MTNRWGRISMPCIKRCSTNEEFAKVVPWLMLNREGLSVLVHPSTGDGYGDHLERSLWLGERLKLNEDVLKRLTEPFADCHETHPLVHGSA